MSENSKTVTQLYFSTINFILRSLPDDVRTRLLPDLESVNLNPGQVLYRTEDQINYIYFPDHALVSVMAMTIEGQSVEIGVVGCEGIIGMEALLGSDSAAYEMVVRHPDEALRIGVAAVRREFQGGGVLHDGILSFARLAYIQAGQTALCNRFHTVEERFAKLLLLYSDRLDTGALHLTHDLISLLLGTNRPTITTLAVALQNTGYITYQRGHLSITDREGLERLSCECFQMIKRESSRFQKLLTATAPTVRRLPFERDNPSLSGIEQKHI